MATITGQKRFVEIDSTPEAVEGVENSTSAQNLEYAEVISGGFQLNENPQFDDIAIEANLDAQPAPTSGGFQPEGTLEVVAAPNGGSVPLTGEGWLRFLLDWGMVRTSGALDSHTVTQYYPISGSDFGRRFTGCKINTIDISLSSTDRLKNPVFGIMGMYPFKSPDSTPASPTFPSYRYWNFQYMSAVISGTAFSTYAGGTTTDNTLRNIQIQVNNNIVQERPGYQYTTAGTLISGVGALSEGDLQVTGSFEIALQGAGNIFDRMLAGTNGQIRLMGFHPNSVKTQINQSAGMDTSNSDDGGASTVNVTVDDDTGFSAGDYCYIEDASASNPNSWVREVLCLSTTAEDSLTFKLDGDDSLKESIGRGQTFTDDSYIYSLGIQLLLRDIAITGWEPVGGARDKVYQRVTFRAGVYSGDHPTEGANYNHPILGYMVA